MGIKSYGYYVVKTQEEYPYDKIVSKLINLLREDAWLKVTHIAIIDKPDTVGWKIEVEEKNNG